MGGSKYDESGPHERSATSLLEEWLRRTRESQYGHYAAAKRLGYLNYGMGIPVVVMSTVVGTSVFASLRQQVDLRLQIGVGLISVLAAVLAGLQTFLRFSEKAEKHRSAGAEYGAIARHIEESLSVPPGADGLAKLLGELRSHMDTLAKEAPEIPSHVWKSKSGGFRPLWPFFL